jgi:hypothetical protein
MEQGHDKQETEANHREQFLEPLHQLSISSATCQFAGRVFLVRSLAVLAPVITKAGHPFI